MSNLGKAFGVGCFWLVATVSAFGVANPGVTDRPDAEAEAVTPQRVPVQDRPAAPARQAPNSNNPLWGIPLKQLSATRDRPIFSPSRRPPPPAAAPVAAIVSAPVQAPKQPERPRLSLVGTIVNGDDGFAIFLDETTKSTLRIRIGNDYQGWTLRAIKAGAATLQNAKEVAVLTFAKPATDQKAPGRVFAGTGPKPALPPLNPAPQSTSFRTPARAPQTAPRRQ